MSNWKIDTAHASVDFKVKHLGLSFVRGQISGVSGEITFDPENISSSKFKGEIDISTITTGVEYRDGHLKSPDFFDIGTYPSAKFESAEIIEGSEEGFKVKGNLTIKDTTKEVIIDVTFLGTTESYKEDGSIDTVAGFSGSTNFNRQDFGLSWNVDLPNGKVLVGNEVELTIDVEAIKQD